MHLHPIKQINSKRFTTCLNKDTISSATANQTIESMHNACIVPNGEMPNYTAAYFARKTENYSIHTYFSNREVQATTLMCMEKFGILQTTQEDNWVRSHDIDSLSKIMDVLNLIIKSEYLNFPMIAMDLTIKELILEDSRLKIANNVDAMIAMSGRFTESLLRLITSTLRPSYDAIKEASAKDKKELITLFITIIKKEVAYFPVEEMNSILGSLLHTYGAPFKNALVKEIKNSVDWNMRHIAAYLTNRGHFPKSDKGVTAFFEYLSQFDGYDITDFLLETKKDSLHQSANTLIHTIKGIPHSLLDLFLSKLYVMTDEKQINIDEMLMQGLRQAWKEKALTGLVYSLLFSRFVDAQGVPRIEKVLYRFSDNLSECRVKMLQSTFFEDTRRSNLSMPYFIFQSNNPYAFSFIQKWINNNECLPAKFIHHAILYDSATILQFLRGQKGFDINYSFVDSVERDNTLTWKKVSGTRFKDETLDTVAQCLIDSGIYDDLTLNDLLTEAFKTRKAMRRVFKFLNERLATPVTTGEVTIKGMKQARMYMEVFKASPLEVLPFTEKHDTKERLLREMVK